MRQKRKGFHVLMHQLGVMNNKEDILGAYGVDSTLELSEAELDELIFRLKQMKISRYEPTPAMRKWRSNALIMINKLGVYADNNDWTRVNRFLLEPRIAGKLLYEMSVTELKALCEKLRIIERKQKQKSLKTVEYSLN